LNADELTKDAIKQNAMIITHGVFYPQADIDENILDEIFNKDVVKKHCTLIQSFPVLTEGITNQLNLFQCQENL
jgi:hypothetical protein